MMKRFGVGASGLIVLAALSGCALTGSRLDVAALEAGEAANLDTLMGRPADFTLQEGDRVLRRYDMGACALLIYLTDDTPTARVGAVSASGPAGPVDPERCLSDGDRP